MKLASLGHAQSNETRRKIAVGVRRGWLRRREKQMVQETCHFEWQNLIAEAARKGYVGEEELQWDSYKILSEKLTVEWVESVEQRKLMSRPKGSKRAPKSLEQRRKIAEAIAAKWADPAYRERVCSALAKYHGLLDGAARKPRRKPSDGTQSTRRNTIKKKTSDGSDSSGSDITTPIQRMKLRGSKAPLYKDPLASSKLEMIKNIRAQRAVSESKKIEAVERARLLIAEAEKAAEALEVAATRSPIAQASLLETRKLIAEAIQWLESIDAWNNIIPKEKNKDNQLSRIETKTGTDVCNGGFKSREVNGTKVVESSEDEEDFILSNVDFHSMLNRERNEHLHSNGYRLPMLDLDSLIKQYIGADSESEPNGNVKTGKNNVANGTNVMNSKVEAATQKSASTSKKWVRGRLVEVTESS